MLSLFSPPLFTHSLSFSATQFSTDSISSCSSFLSYPLPSRGGMIEVQENFCGGRVKT